MPYGPTPDLNRKVVAWAGVNTDGTPSTGTITLMYEGSVMLDDDPTLPVSVYPKKLPTTLSTRTISIPQESGPAVIQTVGYAEWSVPASNDPDLAGSGGTYRVTEDLADGNGQTKSVVVDVAATGTIWLNRMTSVNPNPGEAISAVSVAEFNALKALVTNGATATGVYMPSITTS